MTTGTAFPLPDWWNHENEANEDIRRAREAELGFDPYPDPDRYEEEEGED